jgi:hypothetical protein
MRKPVCTLLFASCLCLSLLLQTAAAAQDADQPNLPPTQVTAELLQAKITAQNAELGAARRGSTRWTRSKRKCNG